MADDDGFVAAPAVGFRDVAALRGGPDRLLEGAGREVVRVPEAVASLRVVLAHEVVRHVAVVADRHRSGGCSSSSRRTARASRGSWRRPRSRPSGTTIPWHRRRCSRRGRGRLPGGGATTRPTAGRAFTSSRSCGQSSLLCGRLGRPRPDPGLRVLVQGQPRAGFGFPSGSRPATASLGPRETLSSAARRAASMAGARRLPPLAGFPLRQTGPSIRLRSAGATRPRLEAGPRGASAKQARIRRSRNGSIGWGEALGGWHRRRMQVVADDLHAGVPGEDLAAGDESIGHRAHRVDVAAGANVLRPAHAFGGHVEGSAHDMTHARHGSLVPGAELLDEAEVEHLHHVGDGRRVRRASCSRA